MKVQFMIIIINYILCVTFNSSFIDLLSVCVQWTVSFCFLYQKLKYNEKRYFITAVKV